MAAELKPYTPRQIREIMIVETKNELEKTRLMERIAGRQHFRATSDKTIEQTLMMCRSKIRAFERSLEDLESIHKEELEKEAKEEDTK